MQLYAFKALLYDGETFFVKLFRQTIRDRFCQFQRQLGRLHETFSSLHCARDSFMKSRNTFYVFVKLDAKNVSGNMHVTRSETCPVSFHRTVSRKRFIMYNRGFSVQFGPRCFLAILPDLGFA